MLQRVLKQADTEVLVVGAGPTGLALAIALANAGLRPRVIDRLPAVNPKSRALIIHARTLELYASVGLAKELLARGSKVRDLAAWVGNRAVATLSLADFGAGQSPFPFMLSLSQDIHERILERCLASLGIAVERGCVLDDYAEVDEGVVATLRHADGRKEILTAKYICGCDGFHSTVRDVAGISFDGDAYTERFFVADVQACGPAVDGRLNVILGASRFAAAFPLEEEGWTRLIGVLPHELSDKDELDRSDIEQIATALPHLELKALGWTSVYHVHHRVAARFREGRAFLLGDAAHVHSPAGGQGMNTGIGDAFNLAWKLAAVAQGRAPVSLLETYESERRPFALRLLQTTDRAFRYAIDPRPLVRAARLRVLPLLLPVGLRMSWVRQRLFRTVSQTAVSYRARGAGGRLKVGDRMPWLGPEHGVHEARVGLRWQIVTLGAPSDQLARYAAEHHLNLVTVPSECCRSGLRRGSAYLLRPDGHVAQLTDDQSPGPFEDYRRIQGLKWRRDATSVVPFSDVASKDLRGRPVSPADDEALRLVDHGGDRE